MKLSINTWLCLAVLAPASYAGVSVSLSSDGSIDSTVLAPTSNVFASTENTAVDSALGWRNTAGGKTRRDIGQSFRVGSSDVVFDKITLKIGGADIPQIFQDNSSVSFSLTIYEEPSASALPSDSGSVIVSTQSGNFSGFATGRTITSGAIASSSYDYITFYFAGVTLTAGKYYSVALSFVGDTTLYELTIANNGNNGTTYTDGTGLYNNGGSAWTTGSDLYFYAQSTSNIPEPASVATLMGLALMGTTLAVRRFKRQR